MNVEEYSRYDGLGLAELVRAKKVKSSELVALAIKQIETYNQKINAVISGILFFSLDTGI